jgi:hypothetical protein
MVADYSDVQMVIGMLILLLSSANYEVLIVTKLFERDARGFLIQQKAVWKEWF